MADDLVQRLRSYAQADDLLPSERDDLLTAADALARKDAEIAALKLERDDFANACEHSADDLRARDAEIAELRRLVRHHELWAMEAQGRAIECEELMEAAIAERDEQRQRAERAEARVREAPVAEVRQWVSGSWVLTRHDLLTIYPQMIGKRVALVLLDTEEAK